MTETTPTGGWSDPEQVEWYTKRVGVLQPRLDGEAALADALPTSARSVLDLGCGDGRLTKLVLDRSPLVEQVVAVDRSTPMLAKAREHFAEDPRVDIRPWDLNDSIQALGEFDLVVSGFAIHHLVDARKRTLLTEISDCLATDGHFMNLEVVSSATVEEHAEFLVAIGRTEDDPEDQLATVDDQLAWMAEAGMVEERCSWRWRGFALLVGRHRGAVAA